MAKNDPQISIFILCYNFEAYIGRCLDSMLAQTLLPTQIVVFDDCSTDGSWDIIQDYQTRFPQLITAHRQPANVGHQINADNAQKRCTGEFVSSIDGDDYWLPEKLEAEWKALQKMPAAALAYSGVIEVDNEDRELGRWINPGDPEPPSGDVFIEVFSKQFFHNMPNVFRNPLVRRDALESVNHFDTSLGLYIDWDLKIRLTARHQVAYSGVPQVVYRRHPQSISNLPPEVHYNDLKTIWNKNAHLLGSRSEAERIRTTRSIENEIARFRPRDSSDPRRLPVPPALPPQSAPADQPNHWKGNGLILLVSLPRSGSTLLQRLLGAHSDIHTVSEPWILMHPLYALKDTGIETDFDVNLARQGLKDFTAELPGGREDYLIALRKMFAHLYEQVRKPAQARFFLDKTPRYYRVLAEIHEVLPEARVVLLYRNPLAVLSSVLRSWMNDSTRLLEQTSNYRDLIEGPAAMLAGEKLLGNQALRVNYEQLLQNPEQTLKNLVQFIGTEYEPKMLDYASGPALRGQLGDKLNSERYSGVVSQHAEEWIAHLAKADCRDYACRYLETLGTDTITAMGYSNEQLRRAITPEQVSMLHVADPAADTQVMNRNGEMLFEQGRSEDALAIFRQALNQAPNDPELLNNTGVVLMAQGNNAEALPLFLRGLSVRNDHPDLIANTASLLAQTGRQLQARELCLAYLKDHPDDQKVSQVCNRLPASAKIEGGEARVSRILDHANELNTTTTAPGRISVLVSTYSSEEFMDECLHDLVNQTIANQLDIIVVDAASPQNEAGIVEQYRQKHPNIRYIRTPGRIGVYAAWNLAIRESGAEYLFTFSTNDRLRRDACEILAHALDSHPEAALVYGDSYLTRTPHQTFERHTRTDTYQWKDYHFEDHLQQCLVGPHPMWRRSVHNTVGQFDESFVAIGDQDMWLRIARSFRLMHVNEVTGLYWQSDDALSHQGERPLQEIARVHATYRKRYENTLVQLRDSIAQFGASASPEQILSACPGFVAESAEGTAALERIIAEHTPSGQPASATRTG